MDAVQDVTHTRAEMHVSRPDHDTLKVFFRSAVNLTMPFQKLATSSFLYSLADVTNNGAVVERACAPELMYLYGADEVRNDPTSMEDFRSLLANIPPGSLLYRMYGKATRNVKQIYIGSITTESAFVASEFGDRILAFQHPWSANGSTAGRIDTTVAKEPAS